MHSQDPTSRVLQELDHYRWTWSHKNAYPVFRLVAERMVVNNPSRDRDYAATLQAVVAGTLREAEPYYVAADIATFVHAASSQLATVAEQRLTADLFPTDSGFCLLEDPIRLDTADTDVMGPLLAYTWRLVTFNGDDSAWALPTTERPATHVQITGFLRSKTSRGDKERSWPGFYGEIILDRPIVHSGTPGPERDFALAFTAFAETLGRFMAQRILVAPRRPVTNRQARRTMLRNGDPDPGARVIQLRRHETTEAHHGPDRAAPDWRCRWLVKGHWRNQFYRSSATNRPIWVLPHVKGPDDKPFRAPKQTVYGVVR